MKYDVRMFKSQKIAIKELEPFIRNGHHLRSGKRFKKFGGALSRELVANWVICAAGNFGGPERLVFCTDPDGGDGLIWDRETTIGFHTEHVLAHRNDRDSSETAEAMILRRIEKKNARGAAYGRGKALVVMLEGLGFWYPAKVTRDLPKPLHFGNVLVIALRGVVDGEYHYTVTRVDKRDELPSGWDVVVAADFESWEARRVM